MRDADGGLLEGGAKALFTFSQLILGPLALGDVAGDSRCANYVTSRISNGRHGQRDVQPPTVLGDAHGLVVVHFLAASDPLEYRRDLLWTFGRTQHGDRLPHSLLGRVAVDPLCPRVPAGDDAVESLADDDVV